MADNWQIEAQPSPFRGELTNLSFNTGAMTGAGALQEWKTLKANSDSADTGAQFTPAVEIYEAAKKTTGKDAPVDRAKSGQAAEKPKDLFELVAQAPANDLGPGMKIAQEATRDYLKDHDGAAYAKKLETAAAKSDSNYADAVAAHWGDLNLARKDMIMHVTDFASKNQSLKETVEALPEEKQATVKGLIGLAMAGQVSDEFKKSIAKELKQYPEVASGLNEMIKSKGELGKAAEAMAKAESPLLDAATEQAQTRYLQAQLKEVNGDKAEAVLMREKAKESFEKTRSTIQGKPYQAKPLISV